MKTLERTASLSEGEAPCSPDEEPLSQEKLQTNERNSDSEPEESESEPSEEESKKSESEPSEEESEEPESERSEEESEEFEHERSEEESEEPESEPSEEESEESEYESSEDESEESGDLVSKSAVSDSKGNKAKGGGGISKKRCFPRVWSLEDEITLLNSIHDFQLKEGREVGPSTLELFCDLLKGRLSFTKRPKVITVLRKIRGLKNKYFHTVKSFTIEHDLKMKEIADRVWKRKSSKRKFPLLEAELRKLGVHDFEMKLKSEEKAAALESRLKRQKIDEMKGALKELSLDKKILKLYLEVYQNSDR